MCLPESTYGVCVLLISENKKEVWFHFVGLSIVLSALSGEVALVCIDSRVAEQIDHVVRDDEHQATALVQPVISGKRRGSSPGEGSEFVSCGKGLSGRKPK